MLIQNIFQMLFKWILQADILFNWWLVGYKQSVIGKATEHTDYKIFKIFIGNGETKHHFFSRDIFVKRNGHCWMRTGDDLIKPVSSLPLPPPSNSPFWFICELKTNESCLICTNNFVNKTIYISLVLRNYIALYFTSIIEHSM